jgi:DNA processing protein
VTGKVVAEAAAAAALAGLPGAGPASLARLLREAGSPADAWAQVLAGSRRRPQVRSGRRPEGTVAWDVAAGRVDPEGIWRSCRQAGIGVTWLGAPDYPAALVDDPLPPPVLFWRGELACLDAPCVALVGTRRCTPDGAVTARELGRDLASAGVCVVSGLALGIDGAAHRGALASGRPGATAGVAASGVDVPYPRRHAELWEAVSAGGAVLSETAPGRPAQAWRFPTRNRVIAGLVRLVVVVESHAAGGSLITAEAALERGIEVRAVPGPVRSPSSAGSNQLLYDGPGPVRDAQDVLDALGDLRPAPVRPPPSAPSRRRDATVVAASLVGGAGPPEGSTAGRPDSGPPLESTVAAVAAAIGWRPTSFNAIVTASGDSVGAVSAALDELVAAGMVVEERGWWQRHR